MKQVILPKLNAELVGETGEARVDKTCLVNEYYDTLSARTGRRPSPSFVDRGLSEGGNLVFEIKPALDNDGPSILRITATTGIFNSTELNCVEGLWNEYLDKREASGYTFLVYYEDG